MPPTHEVSNIGLMGGAPASPESTAISTTRTLISELSARANSAGEVVLRGWVNRLRVLAKTTFVVLADRSGTCQCVGATESLRPLGLKLDDAIEIRGRVRADPRSRTGFEVDVVSARVLNAAAENLPFHSSGDIATIGPEALLDYRPLALRHPDVGGIFKVQAAIARLYREFLTGRGFTEIFSSKIVASGTEGGSNLFEIKYFDRIAYLAQSPQFYKEHGVAGLERVFETGHVYRAEPHATSRHLTEYLSLDLELGFIDGPEEIMQLERELLAHIFAGLMAEHGELILRKRGGKPLADMLKAPTWEFAECQDRLRHARAQAGQPALVDDLDPEAERQLCQLALTETGCPAVFVVGFPLAHRPFYTHPRGEAGAAQSFDLLFEGLEITTGGQRLHRRGDLEAALLGRGMKSADFEGHLRMFELGMPPHGGLAIGLERLTAQVLTIPNVREATLYPRNRYRISP